MFILDPIIPVFKMAASVGVANSSNMYRVGDYVFFENSASGPYAVRRIEELNKTASGKLGGWVTCLRCW